MFGMSLYSYSSWNPVAAEITFLIWLSKTAMNASKIAKELGKQSLGINIVLNNLLMQEILLKNDTDLTYSINSSKTRDIQESLIKFVLEDVPTKPMLDLIHRFVVNEIYEQCQDNLENDEYEIRSSGIINSNFKSFSFDILIQSRRRYGIIIIDDSNKANINELLVHLSYLERIEVYAIFVLVFDRSKCIEQYVIRSEYNTDKSIISLIYFNHRYFSTSPSEISSKISNVVEAGS